MKGRAPSYDSCDLVEFIGTGKKSLEDMFRVSTDALIKHWDCSQDLYSNSLTIPIEWFYSLS